MNEFSALDRLAEVCGILPEYFDIWGRRRRVTPETQRMLLRAMGVRAESEEEVRRNLAAFQSVSWRRILPPVMVVSEGTDPPRIPLSLPLDRLSQSLEWQLREEEGATQEGRVIPRDLQTSEERRVAGTNYRRVFLPLPRLPAAGYHQVELGGPEEDRARMRLIVAPPGCHVPASIQDGGRIWGLSCQLYGLRSTRNWGIGDFSDLQTLVRCGLERGAALIGLSPLHAQFPANPAHCSPYSPSSRLFLNVLYLDVESIPEFPKCEKAHQITDSPQFQHHLRALRNRELVDHPEVAATKFSILELLYREFRHRHLARSTERASEFRGFQQKMGAALRRHATFEALHEHFLRKNPSAWSWQDWPRAYRDPRSTTVRSWAERHGERIEFFEYLQWQAWCQLGSCERLARENGMSVGLFQDLAVSPDPGGAETWACKELYAVGASIGAPPDDFSPRGQDWGLPPLIPHRLYESGYGAFAELLRHNMSQAGALRIDHIMGLLRLFWVPGGQSPEQGAYVRYPLRDLLGILALESRRNNCLIVGEDLGTVPDEVRQALAPMGILSYRLFYFEKEEDGSFKRPERYPRQALVAVSTHDLPTLAGFWEDRDIDLRSELQLYPAREDEERQRAGRRFDRTRIREALAAEQLGLPSGPREEIGAGHEITLGLSLSIHRYLARTPAQILLVQLEDILDLREQANLPGTTNQHPNWRRRLNLVLEDLGYDARLKETAESLAAERPRPLTPGTFEGEAAAPPRATYRLQLSRDFNFEQARRLVPYLKALGISHCYLSPFLKARPGSPHGYDIIDHNSLNPEIGALEDFKQLAQDLKECDMGQIVDIVPNHMGVMGSDTPWWQDVLENGPASVYASFFDIDWSPVKEELRGKVLLPILADHYGRELEKGELRLCFESRQGSLGIRYGDHLFPIDPGEYPFVLRHRIEQLEMQLGPRHEAFVEYQSLISAFGHLPERSEGESDKREERNRDKEVHKRRLSELCLRHPEVAAFIADSLEEFNTQISPDTGQRRLHELLERQPYRLAYWRVAADEINYRRFFDINDLAGLRVEREEVFDATHRLFLQLVHEGQIQGLRIDHPDGLYDPLQYFRRLRTRSVPRLGEASAGQNGLYLVVEKILAGHERLRENWPVEGTTGYDFMNVVNALFVDASSESSFDRLYTQFTGLRIPFDELLYQCKKLIARVSLASEINVLANRLNRLSETDPRTRDFTLNGLLNALIEIVASFPVYRTYVGSDGVSDEDRRYIEWAVAKAKKRSTAADTSIFDFIQDLLLLQWEEQTGARRQEAISDFSRRFQQHTAPVMAKGLEDTALYRYNRLISLNEVGGDPRRFGLSIGAFHRINRERARFWPDSLLCTSTHDSKRGEDARARINALSELPQEWKRALTRWSRMNRSKRGRVEEQPAPSRNDEYLLYQTLLASWPAEPLREDELRVYRERICRYLLKAIREAKVHTSWINRNHLYEEAVVHFVERLLDDPKKNVFWKDFLPFQRRITFLGQLNSLSQTLLKICCPGVPDFYQGSELWNLWLVDPDNRQSVDYACRKRMLSQLQERFSVSPAQWETRAVELLESMPDGRIKMFIIWRALNLRARFPTLFRQGTYEPLDSEGEMESNVCAFARLRAGERLVVAVPRLLAGLTSGGVKPPLGAAWRETRVEAPRLDHGSAFFNVLTGQQIAVCEEGEKQSFLCRHLFSSLPVALLMNRNPGELFPQ